MQEDRMARLLRRAGLRLASTGAALWLSRVGDWLLSAVAYRLPLRGTTENGYEVVLATYGQGNIGDQALLNATIRNLPTAAKIVVERSTDFQAVRDVPYGVETVPIQGLVGGDSPRGRWAAKLRFFRLLRASVGLTVIGADILDGSYNRREAVLRLDLATAARARGVPVRIVSFSWSSSHDAFAAEALRRAALSGVSVYPRDKVSNDRLSALGIAATEVTADVVFSYTAQETYLPAQAWLANRRDPSSQIAIVNVSGLIAKHQDLTEDYLAILTHLRRVGYAVVLLPHVVRSGDDDLSACQSLYGSAADDATLLVDQLLSPAQVGALAAQANLVITGRLHLAILALGRGVPAIVMSTNGKVEGTLANFGLEQLAVSPVPSMHEKVIELVDFVRQDPSILAQIEMHLPAVRERALLPFPTVGEAIRELT